MNEEGYRYRRKRYGSLPLAIMKVAIMKVAIMKVVNMNIMMNERRPNEYVTT